MPAGTESPKEIQWEKGTEVSVLVNLPHLPHTHTSGRWVLLGILTLPSLPVCDFVVAT